MLPSICWDFNTNYGQCIILTQSPLGRKANLSRWKWYPRYRFFHARRCLISVSGRELSTIKRLAFLKNEQRERSLSLSMIALSLSQLFTESSLLFSFFVIVLQIYILMIVIFLQEEIISFLLIPTNLSKFFETFLNRKNWEVYN